MNNLKKITLKEFEELLLKDEELQAKVTEFAA